MSLRQSQRHKVNDITESATGTDPVRLWRSSANDLQEMETKTVRHSREIVDYPMEIHTEMA